MARDEKAGLITCGRVLETSFSLDRTSENMQWVANYCTKRLARLCEKRQARGHGFESRTPDFYEAASMRWKWRERLGRPECPYLVRWVADFWLFSIRIHHWVGSDDQRHMHDHPWAYLTVILKGGYTDVNTSGESRLTPGCVRYFPSSHRHTVRVDRGGAWTLVVTGRERRVWGFWVNGKFRKRNKYHFMFGVHQCEDVKI